MANQLSVCAACRLPACRECPHKVYPLPPGGSRHQVSEIDVLVNCIGCGQPITLDYELSQLLFKLGGVEQYCVDCSKTILEGWKQDLLG